MGWQTPVGRTIACIGLLLVVWGILGMISLVKQNMSETILLVGTILIISGLFLSLFGLGKNFSQL